MKGVAGDPPFDSFDPSGDQRRVAVGMEGVRRSVVMDDLDARRIVALLFVAACAHTPARSPAPMRADLDRHLLALTDDILQAAVRSDRTAMERLIDDGFVYVNPRVLMRFMLTREDVLELWTSGDPSEPEDASSVLRDGHVIHLGATTALVTGVTIDAWKENGVRRCVSERIFDFWHETPRGWQWFLSTSMTLSCPPEADRGPPAAVNP